MAETRMQLAEWLDDLCVRFIINLPQEELESVERICFQVEEAQWYYEDFVRPLDSSLPSMNLRQFCLLIFQVCPFLSGYSAEQHLSAYSQFLAYKTRVPVRGAIMLNEAMDRVVLVKGWKKGSNWSFPRGKINKDEKDLDCAIREVYEETGFDIAAAGLVPDENNAKYLEVTMREQHMQLYVFRNVPMNTPFAARTRKEISKISWWKLASLPGYQKKKQAKQINDEDGALAANKLYMVAPFLVPLKKWIAQQRKRDAQIRKDLNLDEYLSTGDVLTDGDALGDDEVLSDVPPSQLPAISAGLQIPWPQQGTQEPVQGIGVPAQVEPSLQLRHLIGANPAQQYPQNDRAPPQAGASLEGHPKSLLALLRGNSQTSNPAQRTQQIQIDALTPPAVDLHQYYEQRSRVVPPSLPPPQNVFSAQGHPLSGQMRHEQLRDIPGASNVFSTGQFPAQPHAPQGFFNEPHGDRGRGFYPTQYPQSYGPIPSTANVPPPVAPPYQRTGDPLVNQTSTIPGQLPPSIPPASQLPAPKLSAHATNLLNAFKRAETTSVASPSVTTTQLQQEPDSTTLVTTPSQVPPAPHIGPLQTPEVPRPQPQPPSRNNSLQAFAKLIPSNVTPVSRRGSGNNASDLNKRKPSNHQDTLLGLFKAPPVANEDSVTPKQQDGGFSVSPNQDPSQVSPEPPNSQPSQLQSQQAALLGLFKNTSMPEKKVSPVKVSPVQRPSYADVTLPAKSTPQNLPAKSVEPGNPRLGSQETTEGRSTPIMVSKILQRPSATPKIEPPPPKAVPTPTQTVITENKTGTVVKRKPKKAVTATVNKDSRPRTPTTTPVQILKRPANASTEFSPQQLVTRAPEAKSEPPFEHLVQQETKRPVESLKKSPHRQPNKRPTSSSSKKEARPTTPLPTKAVNGAPAKPFQPQILRRPKQSPLTSNASPASMKELNAEEPKEQTSDQRRQNLLSLFTTTQHSVGSQSFSPAATPGSAKSTGPSKESQSPKFELSRSRINSIASPPVLASPSRMSSFTSIPPTGTPGGGGSQSGSRTPISPADRGFLMSYLEGVVKGVQR